MPTPLGHRIRKARREAGFRNAEQFAVALDVGVRTVQRWEGGQGEPSIARLYEIAHLTNRELVWFLSEDGEKVS